MLKRLTTAFMYLCFSQRATNFPLLFKLNYTAFKLNVLCIHQAAHIRMYSNIMSVVNQEYTLRRLCTHWCLQLCCAGSAGKACRGSAQQRSPARGRRIPAAGCNETRWREKNHRVHWRVIRVLGKYCARIRVNAAGCSEVRGQTLETQIWKDLDYSESQT